jgi:NitT/TauT family transport system substrate-binding protein
MNKEGINAAEGGDIKVLQQSFDVAPMVQKQADCIHVMKYNEYDLALHAGYGPENLVIFDYTTLGNDLLEDGLYVLEPTLADPAKVDAYVRFLKASMKGWKYALDNPEEAAKIVVDSDETGAAEYEHQLYMVGEVSKLIDVNDPKLDVGLYDRTIKALVEQKIISKVPEGAYTTAITDKL